MVQLVACCIVESWNNCLYEDAASVCFCVVISNNKLALDYLCSI